jgi:hypothetical protein
MSWRGVRTASGSDGIRSYFCDETTAPFFGSRVHDPVATLPVLTPPPAEYNA